MPNPTYGIVVRVPEPLDICFVARPFDVSFDAAYDDICQAAKEVDVSLTAFTTLDIPRDFDFVSKVFNSIRSAKLIVAICSPELKNGHKTTNINVLYELGLADSLGKPTLLISNGSKDDIPSDIQNRDIVFYANEDVGTQENVERLKRLMNRLVDGARTPDVLAALQPGDIYLVEARQLLLTEETFWRSFRYLLNLSRAIHQTFETFIVMHSKPLVDLSDTIYVHGSQDRHDIRDFYRRWEILREYFEHQIKKKILDRWHVFDPSVRDAFVKMKTLAEGPRAMSQLDQASRYWDTVREKLNMCNLPMDTINRLYEKGTLREELETRLNDVSRHVSDIKNNATDIMNFSGYVSRELLEMFAGGESTLFNAD